MTKRIYIAATGAGAGAQNDIWSVPGCSEYFAGACFPYARDQVDELLGFTPEKYCSTETALDLAMAAYMRAWTKRGDDAIGVGLSASVASKEIHRGDHVIYAAVCYNDGFRSIDWSLNKEIGKDARRRDGGIADAIISDLIRSIDDPDGALDDCGESIAGRLVHVVTDSATERFFKRPFFDGDGDRSMPHPPPSAIIYPGAFNPVHIGHRMIAQEAGGAVFSITQDAPHKGPLTLQEMLQRAKMMRQNREPVWFTRGEPTFLDKARAHPGTTFVIGADALDRMLDPKWGHPIKPMLYELVSLYTRFVVAPRIVNGKRIDLDSVCEKNSVDFSIRNDLLSEIGNGYEPKEISSTAIREAEKVERI